MSNIKKIILECDFSKFVETLRNQLNEPDYSLDEKIEKKKKFQIK